MLETIRSSLVNGGLDAALVDELVESYAEAKRRFQASDFRPNAVEAGRFCEAAFRILDQIVSGSHTPLGTPLDTDAVIRKCANTAAGSIKDSIRLHIPRALRVVFDIRNNRDAAHLGDEIDPNRQDATLVVSVLDWVVAEFLRLYHTVSADEAQRMVDGIINRQVPVVEEFGDIPLILNTRMDHADRLLVHLYRRGRRGALWHELHQWTHPDALRDLQSRLRRLEWEFAYVHFHADTGAYEITATGRQYVEQNMLLGEP